MNSSLFVCVAEIEMQKLENEVNCLSEKILFWRKYIDDIFLMLKIVILLAFLFSQITFHPVSSLL